jgi:hypothetical protein
VPGVRPHSTDSNFFVTAVNEGGATGGPIVRWLDADGKDITPG